MIAAQPLQTLLFLVIPFNLGVSIKYGSEPLNSQYGENTCDPVERVRGVILDHPIISEVRPNLNSSVRLVEDSRCVKAYQDNLRALSLI